MTCSSAAELAHLARRDQLLRQLQPADQLPLDEDLREGRMGMGKGLWRMGNTNRVCYTNKLVDDQLPLDEDLREELPPACRKSAGSRQSGK